MADYDLNAPTNQANANDARLQGIFAGQRADTGDFLSRYTGAINGQESTSAMAGRIGNELGLPTLRANSESLQNTLYNIPSTYSSATRGFDVNSNQLARTIGQKQSEIAPAAQLAEQNRLNAEGQLTTRLGYGQADQAKALLPYQSEQGLLSERMARETSGYTSVMQGELDAIISKMNAGIQISEGEKNRAATLAAAEKQYQAAKESAAATAQNNKYTTVPLGSKLFNNQSGKYVGSWS